MIFRKKAKPVYLYGMQHKKLIILIFLPLFAFSQPSVKWRKALKNGVQSINSAVAITVDKAENIFIAATTHDADSSKKIMLVRLDSSGTETWRRVFQAENGKDAMAVAIAVDPAGNAAITGTVRNDEGNTDIITLKYSPEGIMLWSNIYAGKAKLFDAPAAIATDKKGNVLVSGYETVSEVNPDLLLLRYSASGELSFVKNYSSSAMDVAVDVSADDSCNIYVCGNIGVSTHAADIIVMKFDSIGNPKWNYIYDGEQHAVDVATDFAFDDSTNIFITGSANHANDKADVPLIKLNRNGKLLSTELISQGISDGTGNNLVASGKSVTVQTSFTDFLQQEVTVSIQQTDKAGNQKYKFKSSTEVSYLKSINWVNNSMLLFGSFLSRPENTIAPYIEMTDSLHHTTFVYHDPLLMSLLRIKDVLLTGRDIYFLGDDATENAGTISVARYSLPEVPKNKPRVTNPKKK